MGLSWEKEQEGIDKDEQDGCIFVWFIHLVVESFGSFHMIESTFFSLKNNMESSVVSRGEYG